MATLAVGCMVAGITVLVIRKMIKDKKNGKSQCGGDCSHCGGHCSH